MVIPTQIMTVISLLMVVVWTLSIVQGQMLEMLPHRKRKGFLSPDICVQRLQIPKSTTVQSDIKEDNLVFHLAKIEEAFVCSVNLKKGLLLLS